MTGGTVGTRCASAVILSVLVSGQLLVVLNATIVHIPLPAIAVDLGLSGAGPPWVVMAYLLALGGFFLIGGQVCDLLGARRVLIVSTAAFTAAALVAGLAPTGGVLIGARAAQGAAAAALAPSALSLLTALFPPGIARRRALGVWAAVTSAGGAVGGLAGGLLTDRLSWRAVLLVNVPVGITVLLAVIRVVPVGTPSDRAGRPDVAGTAASALGLTCLLLAITIGRDLGWAAPGTLGLLGASVVLLAAFVLVQARSAHPLLPRGVLRCSALRAGNLWMLLAGGASSSTLLLLSSTFHGVLGYPAMTSGQAMLPLSVATITTAALAQCVVVAGPRPFLAAGLVLMTAGTSWLAVERPPTGYLVGVLGPALAFGVGLGLAFVAVTALALADVASDVAPLGGRLVNASQQLGGAAGVAVITTVVSARTAQLATTGAPVDALAGGYRLGFAGAAALTALALVTLARGSFPPLPRQAPPGGGWAP